MLRKVLKKVDFLKIVKLSTKSNNKSLLKKVLKKVNCFKKSSS